MRARKCRGLVDSRAVYTVLNIRSRNISGCCLMNKAVIFHYKSQTRAYNTDFFSIFIDDVLAKFESENINSALIMLDNVPFHRSAIISQKIIDAGHGIMFLPTYSPFLNPIENVFSQWKQHIRSARSMNESDLLSNIENASRLIIFLALQ
jgi:transposase